MPEAAMDKHDCCMTLQNNVRRSRKGFLVQPKTEAKRVKHAADYQLRAGVLSTNGGHVSAALVGGDLVHCEAGRQASNSDY